MGPRAEHARNRRRCWTAYGIEAKGDWLAAGGSLNLLRKSR
jgi:hypothetical protein